jgi:tRNA(fMet)-specific endonuclease VapC
MNLLLDTNILLYLTRDVNFHRKAKVINPDDGKLFTSIATAGELKSIALQNKWGEPRLQILNRALYEVVVVELNENLANIYAEIDAFSQRKNPAYGEYSFPTPRNMGKNDLWIAATAALLGLKLVTTDADFNHLNGIFIEVERLRPESLK